MLGYIALSKPSEDDLLHWVKTNTRAESDDGIRRRLSFIERIGLITFDDSAYRLTERGRQCLEDTRPDVLYHILSEEVHGFDTIIETLSEKPKTDQE